MEWNFILMIVWSLCYISWKIYLYSTSITITYTKPSTGKVCDFKRWKSRIKYYIKWYFKWYGFKHFRIILFIWMVYGGFFIW